MNLLVFCSLFFSTIPPLPRTTLFPYTTLFRSLADEVYADLAFDGPVPAFASQNLDAPVITFSSLSKADRKSTRLNSSHSQISYAVFCLKKKKKIKKKSNCVIV